MAGRLGRPKDGAKHAAILEAARSLFSRQPFDLVTMEAVAAAAAVSKMTVYSHFQDKETLFEAFISLTADAMIGALPAGRPEGALRDRLLAIGEAFLGIVVGSEMCSVSHTTTLRTNRVLAERFYAAGPLRVRAALASILTAAQARGELTLDDAGLAADDLINLWLGNRAERIAFGLAHPAAEAEVKTMAARGTDVFLRAYRGAGPKTGLLSDGVK